MAHHFKAYPRFIFANVLRKAIQCL